MSTQPPGKAPAAPQPTPPQDGMRRLQIGIAGVLTVLLLVGMAGLIGERARENAAQGVAPTAEVKVPGEEQKAGSAPLEELGVQPVSDQSANKAAPAPVEVPPAKAPPRAATGP
ncbi:MAG: hypothetical protein IBJ13_15350, partial [Sphingopyxis sp.]|nr:hypothetical protein [Sphingopyxis sp.]